MYLHILNKLPRFTGSGEIKAADIPKQIRGEALLDYIDQLTSPSAPPQGGGKRAEPWTPETAPRRVSTITAAIKDKAHELRARGFSWRKVGGLLGLDQTTIRRAIS